MKYLYAIMLSEKNRIKNYVYPLIATLKEFPGQNEEWIKQGV